MPRAGARYLNPVEVIRRVQGVFAYVETVEEGTRRQVLEWMSQLAFIAADGRAAADDNYLLSVVTISDPAQPSPRPLPEGEGRFVVPMGCHPFARNSITQLEQLQDSACFVHFGDDVGADGVLLSMLMIPHQPLVIEYSSHAHKEKAQALIARCAAVLDYEIVEQENAAGNVEAQTPYSTPCARAA